MDLYTGMIETLYSICFASTSFVNGVQETDVFNKTKTKMFENEIRSVVAVRSNMTVQITDDI